MVITIKSLTSQFIWKSSIHVWLKRFMKMFTNLQCQYFKSTSDCFYNLLTIIRWTLWRKNIETRNKSVSLFFTCQLYLPHLDLCIAYTVYTEWTSNPWELSKLEHTSHLGRNYQFISTLFIRKDNFYNKIKCGSQQFW